MALASGQKIGPYEIRSPLGAGGMGEVYRATDSKLGRDEALKVLPAEMGQDAGRPGRFRREAKSLAQLDHPNIVTIYSVEEFEGIHLGRPEDARTAIESLRKYSPTFLDLENVREDVRLWDPDKDEVERFLQGLQKAGLKYGSRDSAPMR